MNQSQKSSAEKKLLWPIFGVEKEVPIPQGKIAFWKKKGGKMFDLDEIELISGELNRIGTKTKTQKVHFYVLTKHYLIYYNSIKH